MSPPTAPLTLREVLPGAATRSGAKGIPKSQADLKTTGAR